MNMFYLQWFPEHTTADGMPVGPRAYIALKTCSHVPGRGPKGDCGFIAISPECVNATEISTWVDAMIRELQTIRRQADAKSWRA